MRVVHESGGERRVLATDVEVAESLVEKTVGLMGRSSVPDDYALVFEFEPSLAERAFVGRPWPVSVLGESARMKNVHMLFVRTPIDVIWLREGEVVKVRTLDPWRGYAGAKADTVVELAAGAADGVEPGDRIHVEDGDEDQTKGPASRT